MSKPKTSARSKVVLNTKRMAGRARKKPRKCQVKQTLHTGGRCR